jgi:hypothetical protein
MRRALARLFTHMLAAPASPHWGYPGSAGRTVFPHR